MIDQKIEEAMDLYNDLSKRPDAVIRKWAAYRATYDLRQTILNAKQALRRVEEYIRMQEAQEAE